MSAEFVEVYRKSLEDPIGFWEKQAERLYWRERWEKTYDDSNPPFYRWFVGGKTNISYNALDRHVKGGRANKAALIWVSADGATRVLRYWDLYREVNRFAVLLKSLGVERGDRVAIYMPMIPEAMVAMLAVNRIGAVHTVVFSGFGPQALAERIKDAEAKVVITADGMRRRGRVIPLKPTVDEALKIVGNDIFTVVYKHTGVEVPMKQGRDLWWQEEIAKIPPNTYIEPEWVPGEAPLFILYTSGTTGKPKGILHLHGQYMVWIWYAFNHLTGAERDFREDIVFFSTADIGWISGHHYGVHGPLLNGLTVLWYEDAPDYPHPGIWWEIADTYKVTHMLFSPTAIRLLMKYGDEWPRRYKLDSIMALYPTGEVLNEEAYNWMRREVCRGRPDCQIADIWGQTETACFVTAPGSMNLGGFRYKYGSVGMPYPTLNLQILDDDGKPLPPGAKGHVVAKPPLPPAFLHTLWRDPERYVKSYWSRFPGYYYTGDLGYIDQDGHLHIMGRSDDVIKVAGHRLSTREVEDILTSHPAVAEAAVVGVPDEVRGEVLGVFVVPKQGMKITEEEVVKHLRNSLGPVAVIGKVAILDKLPKTRTGKVMRRVLRAMATGQPVGDLSTLEDEEALEELRKKLG
ncbi:acetate--CoA ligase [Pyrobaculum neutrophilum]|uniref:AMP-dependent synthetase and ligase n=1 Tax=Pyrobaculum neutrophilum (strain DSM 2338 / JCM 9278 / NBRC 100436 / V24Sta) TaxID=444157 RepID=B1YBY4_PYRNV|nr:acetate--CoA ligase [Pyrobaculum neutrophilum]ACB39368.1 AMP-dependent synthetase and ligase [Pyrobaculum neutrophilum V24Sta]